MSGTINIGRLFGISVKIHFSWVFIFALVAGTLAVSYLPSAYSGWPTPQYWIMGILASALLFACVLAHELSHSLEAMRRGRKVTSITLFFLGGVSQIEEESRSAGEEFWVSVVGPLASLALSGIFLLLFLNFRDGWRYLEQSVAHIPKHIDTNMSSEKWAPRRPAARSWRPGWCQGWGVRGG